MRTQGNEYLWTSTKKANSFRLVGARLCSNLGTLQPSRQTGILPWGAQKDRHETYRNEVVTPTEGGGQAAKGMETQRTKQGWGIRKGLPWKLIFKLRLESNQNTKTSELAEDGALFTAS